MDPVASSQLGFSRQMTETQLAVATGSLQVGGVWERDYEVPLMLRDPQAPAFDTDDIGSLRLTSPYGSQVQLRQVADVHPEWAATNIVHRGGKRCVTVTCDTRRGVYTQALHQELQDIVRQKISLPQGVQFEVGGEPEDDANKMGYIRIALSVSILIMFFFVLFNFRRYKMALVCLAAIVLIVPGTVIGLALMNRFVPLTLIYGVVALIGMLMRNEILIFEHADDMRAQGLSVRDAAYDAGRRRMVPIFLTTATTAVGVIPMILAQSSFWMPVGVAIFSGGIVALILTVIVLPVVYWKLNDKKTK
jgi:multidrug efflux pump subunit AcrB